MKAKTWKLGVVIAMTLALALPDLARAHCDTLDGPVVTEARAALAKGDVTPVLKWVRAQDEEEIRTAFDKTLAVRRLGSEARDLADMYFFETLVRLHRAGEGESYAGLKPAGTIEPAVERADQALAKRSVEALVKSITRHVEEGIQERFARAVKTKKHADENVRAGREYVEAYVTFIHYVEGIAQAALGTHSHLGTARHEH